MPEVKGLKELKLSVGQRKGKADMAEIIYKIFKNILLCLLLLFIFCHAEFISASIQ
jgi:hypothetical protein